MKNLIFLIIGVITALTGLLLTHEGHTTISFVLLQYVAFIFLVANSLIIKTRRFLIDFLISIMSFMIGFLLVSYAPQAFDGTYEALPAKQVNAVLLVCIASLLIGLMCRYVKDHGLPWKQRK